MQACWRNQRNRPKELQSQINSWLGNVYRYTTMCKLSEGATPVNKTQETQPSSRKPPLDGRSSLPVVSKATTLHSAATARQTVLVNLALACPIGYIRQRTEFDGGQLSTTSLKKKYAWPDEAKYEILHRCLSYIPKEKQENEIRATAKDQLIGYFQRPDGGGSCHSLFLWFRSNMNCYEKAQSGRSIWFTHCWKYMTLLDSTKQHWKYHWLPLYKPPRRE